jgi:Mce-associated membrane protein
MPPPPRRRRPVQPATRVRLPRAARPRGEPAGAEAPGQTTAGPSNGDTRQANGLAASTAQPKQVPEGEPGTAVAGQPEPAGLLTDEAPAAGAAKTTTAEAEAAEAEAAEAEAPEAEAPATRPTKTGPSEAGQSAELADGTGAAEPDEGRENDDWAHDEAEPVRDRQAGKAAAGGHVREPLLLPVCLGVVAVALGGLAVWFGLKSSGTPTASTGFGAGTANAAVVDHAATAQVTQQIDTAVDTIFSYNYTDTARTSNAAKNLLVGKARAEYATLFKVVQQQAPKEKLVLTTTVTNSGVEMLNGNTARLLIFANQKDTGATKASTTEAGAMFAVTAVRQNGQWKIDSIDTFSAPG